MAEVNREPTSASTQRVVKIVLAIAIGVTFGWFLVETFLPIPYPHAAY